MKSIDLTPEEYHQPEARKRALERAFGSEAAAKARIVHRTLDCRHRKVVYHVDVELSADAPETPLPPIPDRPERGVAVIVGAGPAGLFAALRALELGIRPVIVDRGKPVEARKRDVARLAREKVVDPDSNWCFGEGGAGTYSDGKLYTRSTKRGDVRGVLQRFVAHGADPDIMLDAHAHIGTDRLSGIIASIRRTIEAHGGLYLFGSRVVDIDVKDGRVCGVVLADGTRIDGDAVVLATGHSARDVYSMFASHGWQLEAKPFAMGVRVEHPQQLINEIQYHGKGYSPYLPPAAYSLTTQTDGRGVFSFCMCPGGVIVPAATAEGQQVVNGMSNSRRNSPFANSGIAVTVGLSDAAGDDPLALLRLQQAVEERMFHAAGDAVNAPSQRLVDFLSGKPSSHLPSTGYLGDVVSAPLHELLPPFITTALQHGFADFDRRMRGFITGDATLLAVESRTSSPVRIPRDRLTLQHPQLAGLYPCGEGAGYAGGIVSSALDGIRCIEAISLTLRT